MGVRRRRIFKGGSWKLRSSKFQGADLAGEFLQAFEEISLSPEHGGASHGFTGGGIRHGLHRNRVGPRLGDNLHIECRERNTDKVFDMGIHDPSREGAGGRVMHEVEVELVFAQFDGDPAMGGIMVVLPFG